MSNAVYQPYLWGDMLDMARSISYEEPIWRQIDEFPNYWVSNQGQVFNMRRKRLVKISRNDENVPYVTFHKGERIGYSRSIRKLVWKYFGEKIK